MNITRYAYPFTQGLGRSVSPFFARRCGGAFENPIEQILDSVINQDNAASAFAHNGLFPVDIYEDKDNSYVRAELAGVDRKDISVEVVDGNLEISATRKIGAGEEAETLSFKRTIRLPDHTQTDKVSAVGENGILMVTIPKQEAAKPRKLTVAVQ